MQEGKQNFSQKVMSDTDSMPLPRFKAPALLFSTFFDIIIWYADDPSEKYKMWTGEVFKIPKKFKKYQLVEAENNDSSQALYPIEDGELRITIVKKQ